MNSKVSVGDSFAVGKLMPGVCDEQVLLTAVGVAEKDKEEDVVFNATFFGVHLCKAKCRVINDASCVWEVL